MRHLTEVGGISFNVSTYDVVLSSRRIQHEDNKNWSSLPAR
jgi:hypothetical protein